MAATSTFVPTPFDEWLDRVVTAAVCDLWGEPGKTPEEQLIRAEEQLIRFSGKNLLGGDVSDEDYPEVA